MVDIWEDPYGDFDPYDGPSEINITFGKGIQYSELSGFQIDAADISSQREEARRRAKEYYDPKIRRGNITYTGGKDFLAISAKSTGYTRLTAVLRKIRKNVEYLKPLFRRYSKDFFATNKKLIFSEAPGRFPDLTSRTKAKKREKHGKEYPILVGFSRLQRSLTDSNFPEAINVITNKSLRIGTEVDYAAYHQEGTDTLPMRKPMDLDVGDRLTRWIAWANEAPFRGMPKV